MYTTNLNALASHLEALPAGYLHFDMESYFHDPRVTSATEYDEMLLSIRLLDPVMGMCGCAMGHSAAAGVMLDFRARTWLEAAKYAYGVEGEAYEYLFGGDWYVSDNTPKGAAARIRTYLESGVPADWREDEAGIEIKQLSVIDFIRIQNDRMPVGLVLCHA